LGQSVCTLGQQVFCGGFGAAAGSPRCTGNECCPDEAGSGLTHVCPSAEPGWTGCDEPKRRDCLGGMYGERVIASSSAGSPVLEPLLAPKKERSNDADEALWGVCWPALCPIGFRLKSDLPEDMRCEEVKCTQDDCCTKDLAPPPSASTTTTAARTYTTSSSITTTMQIVGDVVNGLSSTMPPLSEKQLEAKMTTTTTVSMPTTPAGTTTTSHTLGVVSDIMKHHEGAAEAPAATTPAPSSGMSIGLGIGASVLFIAACCAAGYMVDHFMHKKDNNEPEFAQAGPAVSEGRASLRSEDRL